MGYRGEVFSERFSNDNRTYFFNVKENRKGDLYLNIVESKEKDSTGFERHQIVVFKEDLENFLSSLNRSVDFMKNPKKPRAKIIKKKKTKE